MKDLITFLATGLAAHPDDVEVTETEGDASTLIELSVHEDDEDRLRANDSALFHAMQAVAAASAGKRKTVIDLVTWEDEGEE